mmetsp:Transcript_100413/g.259344  ORF Transcript_100413/g.259344 Transcript_100413/m.259344 type:complete len:347 (-) Transcript_100413:263-1303(-)
MAVVRRGNALEAVIKVDVEAERRLVQHAQQRTVVGLAQLEAVAVPRVRRAEHLRVRVRVGRGAAAAALPAQMLQPRPGPRQQPHKAAHARGAQWVVADCEVAERLVLLQGVLQHQGASEVQVVHRHVQLCQRLGARQVFDEVHDRRDDVTPRRRGRGREVQRPHLLLGDELLAEVLEDLEGEVVPAQVQRGYVTAAQELADALLGQVPLGPCHDGASQACVREAHGVKKVMLADRLAQRQVRLHAQRHPAEVQVLEATQPLAVGQQVHQDTRRSRVPHAHTAAQGHALQRGGIGLTDERLHKLYQRVLRERGTAAQVDLLHLHGAAAEHRGHGQQVGVDKRLAAGA